MGYAVHAKRITNRLETTQRKVLEVLEQDAPRGVVRTQEDAVLAYASVLYAPDLVDAIMAFEIGSGIAAIGMEEHG